MSATAAVEAATGLALIAIPARVASLLLGATLETSAGLVVARVAGAGLLALAIGCWLARTDTAIHSLRGLLLAMLFYNACTVFVLLHAHFVFGLSGPGLYLAVVLHAVFAPWAAVCLAKVRVPLHLQSVQTPFHTHHHP